VKVGYVLKKFPRLSETFILHEILGLEEQGVRVGIVSLRRPDDEPSHSSIGRLRAETLYVPGESAYEAWDWFAANRASLEDALARLPDALTFLLDHRVAEGPRILAEAVFVLAHAHRSGFDHLHAHFATGATIVAHLVRRLGGPPYSFTCHAKDIYRQTVNPALYRALADGARFVVTVCDANRRFLEENLYAGGATPVERVYNGIDLERFRPAARAGESPTIVAVGRLVPKKGFAILVAACAILRRRGRPFRCLLLGDGEERASLEKAAAEAELGPAFQFRGAVTQEEVLEALRGAAVVCAPCVVGEDGNQDALPTVLLEALASGVPAVATPVGGIPEIVRDGIEGRLVPPGDAGALADALDELLSAPRARERMGLAGRRRAEDLFDLRKNVARLAALFEGSATASRVEAAR
jgi:glycosyltransferase involved in cell wall biosynthesis